MVNNGIDMINRVTGHKDTPPTAMPPPDPPVNDSPPTTDQPANLTTNSPK